MLTPRNRQILHNIYQAGGFVTGPALSALTGRTRQASNHTLRGLASAGWVEEVGLTMGSRYPNAYKLTHAACYALDLPPLSLPDGTYQVNVLAKLIACHALLGLMGEGNRILSGNVEKVCHLARLGCTEEMFGAKTLQGRRYPHIEEALVLWEPGPIFVHCDKPDRKAASQLENRLEHLRPMTPLLPAEFLVCVDSGEREAEYRLAWDSVAEKFREIVHIPRIRKISYRYYQ